MTSISASERMDIVERPGVDTLDDGPDVAGTVEDVVESQPWMRRLARSGWLAKGFVYVLMGLTTMVVGRGGRTSDEASPEGALSQVREQPGGAVLLVALSIGLVLYAVWRLLSTLLVRGAEPSAWAHRVGYLFSASFYAVLAFLASRAALVGDDPKKGSMVEELSSSLLGSGWGRAALLVGGLTALGVGVYFVVGKGLQRSFLEDLDFESAQPTERRLVVWSSVLGWMGRGIVTMLVGWFVVRSAWTADTAEARGFDRAVREVAAGSVGGLVVMAAGVMLVVYGVSCWLSMRFQRLEATHR